MQTPWLLDRDMKPLRPLHPARLSLRQRLKPLSSARMTLPPEEGGVLPGDFIRIQDPAGESAVYRVTRAETMWPEGSTEVQLQHGLCTLSDSVVFGQLDFLGLDTEGDTGAVIVNGVVRVRRARLRQSPSYSAQVLAEPRKDELVAITGAKRSWYAVTYGSVKGWMSKSTLINTLQPVLSLRDVALRLLNTQPGNAIRWTLGDFGVEEHQGVSFANCNALTALLTLPQVASETCEWRFDQSVLPWRLGLTHPESAVTCELRPSRNMTAVSLIRSREELCTRLYPSGKDGLTIEELTDGFPYIDTGEEEIAERILLLPQEQNDAALLRRARVKLDSMEGPRCMAKAEVIDLYPETGNELDRIRLGAMCRLILPDRSSRELRVTAIDRPDMIRAPRQMTVTLAGPQSSLTELLKQSGSGERLI